MNEVYCCARDIAEVIPDEDIDEVISLLRERQTKGAVEQRKEIKLVEPLPFRSRLPGSTEEGDQS